MDKQLIKDLQILKRVKPDIEFVESTRAFIFATEPRKVISWANLLKSQRIWAYSFAVLILIVASFGLILNEGKDVHSASLDQNLLKEEFENFSINIHLQEISYRQDINQTIASALTEISDSRVNHLNRSILESEQNLINEAGMERGSDIDELLNKVIN